MDLKSYIPHEDQIGLNVELWDNLSNRVGVMLFLAVVVCWSHYLIQLQTVTLIIEKFTIQKQQRQIFEFFQT